MEPSHHQPLINHRLPFLLFVIADGYKFPVESRDDLVRHGYLRAE